MTLSGVLSWAGLLAAAYLLGSVPFGYVMGRLAGKDIRKAGSHNIGATNCWRLCGWKFGLPAFLLDVGKGFAAAHLARIMVLRFPLYDTMPPALEHLLVVLAGAAVILGHIFPVTLGFRGGKAVATSLGVFLGMPAMVPLACGAFVVWMLVFAATRIVSAASTAAALALLAAVLTVHVRWPHVTADPAGAWTERWPVTAFTVLLVALVLWRHRSNYRRLLAGTESRFGRPGREPPEQGQ